MQAHTVHAHAVYAHAVHVHVMHAHIIRNHFMHSHSMHTYAMHCMLSLELTATCQLLLQGQNQFNSGMLTQLFSSSELQQKLACR